MFRMQNQDQVHGLFSIGRWGCPVQHVHEVAGMAQISSAVQAGGSGFNLLGAAAEYQADMAKAQADMGAGAMRSVGQSMEGLGAAGRLAGGALSFLAQAAEHNAQLRREAARIRNQLFMNMGDKFSKSLFKFSLIGGHKFTLRKMLLNIHGDCIRSILKKE